MRRSTERILAPIIGWAIIIGWFALLLWAAPDAECDDACQQRQAESFER